MNTEFLYPCKPTSLAQDDPHFEVLDRDPDWIAELKLNGWRCLIEKTDKAMLLWTRHRKLIHDPVEHLREPLQHLPIGTLLDGELIAYRTPGINPGYRDWRKVKSPELIEKSEIEFPIFFRSLKYFRKLLYFNYFQLHPVI